MRIRRARRHAGALAIAAAVALSVAGGCSVGSGRPFARGDRGAQVLALLRDRQFEAVAATLPTPPTFVAAEVERYRAEVRQLLRILSVEFGTIGTADRIDDGTLFYSLRVAAPEHFDCDPVAASYRVDYAKRGAGVIHMVYCDDRAELTLASLAYGLDSTRDDARTEVVDVCTATTMAMGWSFDADTARRGCEAEIPLRPVRR